MIKTSRQLKDLIRNLSKEKKADAQVLMRNYMMERFAGSRHGRARCPFHNGYGRYITNTRMRDFYDIYILMQLHSDSLNPADFRSALLATAKKRGSEELLAEAEAVFDDVENSPAMQRFWSVYRKKFSYAADLSWDAVMQSVRKLYEIGRNM